MNQKSDELKLNPLFLLLLVVVVIGLGALTLRRMRQNASPPRQSERKPALELPPSGTWLNPDAPLSLAALRGKVVLLQFSFLGCAFCRKMDAPLKRWQETLGPSGLQVIEADDGNIDTLAQVRAWLTEHPLPFPIYYDVEGKAAALYGVDGYPFMLLIGRDGTVLWQQSGWSGEAGLGAIEQRIREALGSNGPASPTRDK